MRKFERAAAPEFLVEKWELWGQEWAAKLQAQPGASFAWRQHEGETVNQKLLPSLAAQTQQHCSYCDAFPVSPPSRETIDHFRPKAKFPLEAYQWENLYYCCDFCQQRPTPFSETLLRPDGADYSFDRFFRWDFTTGRILVNEQASLEDQQRAELSRAHFRLNEKHPRLRLREARLRSKDAAAPIEDFAYRDFLDQPHDS